jgi:hypothetical protein
VSDEALFDLVTGGTPVADPVSNAVPFFHVIANFLEKRRGGSITPIRTAAASGRSAWGD